MGGSTQISLKTTFHGEHCCLTAQLSCHTSKSASANMPKHHFPELPVGAEPSRVGQRLLPNTGFFLRNNFCLGTPHWPGQDFLQIVLQSDALPIQPFLPSLPAKFYPTPFYPSQAFPLINLYSLYVYSGLVICFLEGQNWQSSTGNTVGGR